jgi:chromosome segregation ATPase
MMKNLILILSVVGLFSCGRHERERLTAQVDSLQYELNESQQATQTLMDVGMLMDSIDASRQLLRSSMVEGTTYNDYVARMTDINNYVKETEKKIADLEKTTKKSLSKANSLAATIKKLRNELATANKEMESLQTLVAQYKSENGNLVQSISLKDGQLAEHEERVRVTQQEMTLLQAQLEEVRTATKQTEAEAYYARAQAVEETANRTKFAPRKKKESRKQALELYKLAFQMGKEEAQPKIEELEKKI